MRTVRLNFCISRSKELTSGILIILICLSTINPLLLFAQETVPEIPSAEPVSVEIQNSSSTPAPTLQESFDASMLESVLDTQKQTAEVVPAAESQTTSSDELTPKTDESNQSDTDQDQQQMITSGGQEGEAQVVNPTFTYQSISPKVDKTTGALVETLKLSVPPGRNGMQPDLALAYNSQRLEESVVGYGWTVNIPYIERINRRGTNNLYSDDYFNSSLSGELASTTVSGVYRARVEESDSLLYSVTATSTGGSWTVYDKRGTRYLFGTAASSRQDDSNNTAHTFKWMLDEVRDTNGNFIRYTYYKDNGQIYPSVIYYTGSGQTDGIFTVEFSRESRPDVVTSYSPAFLVKTNYRINRIQAKINGTWVKQYDIAYTTGSNGYRSLLSSVTETGQDESGANTLSLPATTFEYINDTVGFTTSGSMDKVGGAAWALADTDGNGLLDENVSHKSLADGYYYNFIQLNFNGSISQINANNPAYYEERWAESYSGPNSYYPLETGTRYVDLNSDGMADVLRSFYNYTENSSANGIYWNDGTHTDSLNLHWTLATTSLNLPMFGWQSGSTAYTLGLIANLNGDGLIDYEKANSADSSANGAFFGDGRGLHDYTASSYFAPLATLPSFSGGYGNDVRLVDINGDGLDDFVYNSDSTMKVCFNTGLAWETSCNSAYTLATTTVDSYGNDKGVRFLDMNGDGLLDFVRSYSMSSYTSLGQGATAAEIADVNIVKLNTGSGFATSTISLPAYIVTGHVVSGMFMGDFYYNEMWDWSGDGLADGYQKLNSAKKPDMLEKINYSTGGSTEVEYTPTTSQLSNYWGLTRPKHYNLPTTVYTVTKITNNDTSANPEVITYSYENGDLYFGNPYDRKFAGFESITETKTDTITKTYYYQGNVASTTAGEFDDHYSKIGKPYREEITNPSNGNLFKRVFSNWSRASLYNNRNFVFLASTTEETFDGDSDHKDKAAAYTYDLTTGSLIQKIEYGEVTGNTADGTFTDTGSDLSSTTISYIASTTVNMHLPYQETTQDQSGNKVKEERYYYDTLSLGEVAKGNLTKREDWKDTTNYVNVQKTYNSYGLVTRDTDPLGKNTDYTYDAYNLYVATLTNPLSQAVSSQYDYSSGKVKQITDANSRVFTSTFDPLDRLTEEKQPDITTPTTLVTKNTYTYTTGSAPQNILKTGYLNSATSTTLYTYFDGLGRKIQERKEAEGENTYAVKDYSFNNAGKLARETLSYFASSTSWATSTAGSGIFTNYIYDPLGRVSAVGTIVGTTTSSFDDWKTTVTDPLSKQKDFFKDALGNLTSVVEHIGGDSATTAYEYNRLNNLTKITDALGNIRNFTYDGLGRRLTAEDLRASGDGTYGTWTYTYNDAGNLTSQVDPKSQTVNFTYDDLGRPLTEDYTGQGGTEISYGYDFCAEGVGRSCSATSTSAVANYAYNALGLIKTESKQIASSTTATSTFATAYGYDRLGNTTQITYPDNSETQYIFNDAGLPEKINYRATASSAFSSVLSAIDYSPLEQEKYLVYANNIKTCNTYNASELYRLSAKRTTAFGFPCSSVPSAAYATSSPNVLEQINLLQELSYAYDAAGNITAMSEDAPTGLGRAVDYSYDNLHRLSLASTTDAASNSYRHAFTYNSIGNITSVTNGNAPSTNSHSLDLERSSNQYAYRASDLGITGGTITMEAWVKFESLPSTNQLYEILQQSDGGTGVQYKLRYYNVEGTKKLYWIRNREWVWGNAAIYTVDFAIDTWYHFVGTYDGTNLRLYVAEAGGSHNLVAGPVTDTGNGATAADDFAIGINDDSGGSTFTPNAGRYFDGQIDDVRVWNTVRTLNDLDINFEEELDGNEYGLAGYYKLNDNYVDLSSGENDLTGSGSPVFVTSKAFSGGSGNVTTYTYASTGYANPHASTGIESGGATTTYNYDNNGNLTSAGPWTYTWDYRNRITSAGNGTATSTYYYDNAGDRVKQVAPSITTFYPSKSYSVASTTTGSSYTATSTVYIYSGNNLVATIDRLGTTTPRIRSLATDHLSSTGIITDENGDIARVYDYYPFGAPRIDTGSITVQENTGSAAANPNSLDLERSSNQHAYRASDLGITGGTITMEAWVKFESLPSTNQLYEILQQSDGGTGVQYKLRYYNVEGTKKLYWIRNREWVWGSSATYTVDFATDTWYHLVGTYDGTNLRLYVAEAGGSHNLVAGPVTDTGNGATAADDFAIGINDDSGGSTFTPNAGRYFDGLIEDVRVWNTALSTSTMNTNFETELQGNESNLIAYYKLNDSYTDQTTNGYNLTGVNNPAFSASVPFGDGGGEGALTTYYYGYGTTTVSRQYIGQYYDEQTELSYLNARYYDPNRGQFLSEDPAVVNLSDFALLTDPQQQNSYSYARNNPITLRDADGKRVEIIAKALEQQSFGTHVFLLMTPDNPGDFGLPAGSNWTVGGYADNETGSTLIKKIDAQSDRSVVDNGYSIPETKQGQLKAWADIQGPDNLTDTQFITSIMDQYDAYAEDAAYDPFSRNGYNSNNLVSTFLVNSGAKKLPWKSNAPGIDPGYGQAIPTNYTKTNGQMAPSGPSAFSSYTGQQGSRSAIGAIQSTLSAISNALTSLLGLISSK